MKRCIMVIIFALSSFVSIKANSQVTSNVFRRVLNVRVNGGTDHPETATAFTIDVDGREYLITAKHVVHDLKDNDSIDIFMNNQWSPLSVKIFRCQDPTDIAVLIPPYQLTVNFDLPFEGISYLFGQEVYFLGFPYGIQSPAHGANSQYPLALIKRGTFSGQVPLDATDKVSMILIDGYNNRGFSGGPIVYKDLYQPGTTLKLAGVVSGFVPEVVPAMSKHDIKSPADASPTSKAQPWKIQRKSDGTYFEYVESGAFVALNTGIVQGYPIGQR